MFLDDDGCGCSGLCVRGRCECLRCDLLLGFVDDVCLDMNGERSW